MTTDVSTELQDLLDAYCAAWHAHDIARLEALWDASYLNLIYVAEERREPMIGIAAIGDYYRYTLDVMEWMKVKLKPLSADVLGDIAWVVCKGSWGGQNRQRDRVSGGHSTVSFWARRTAAGGWRLIQYVEAPANMHYAA